MSKTARHLRLALKQVFNQRRGTNEKVTKLATEGQLSSTFAQARINEAAAYEVAAQRVMFTEDFVDNELLDIPESELVELIKERQTLLTDQLMQAVSLNMGTADVQVLNGTKIALSVYLDCIKPGY